MSRPSGLPARPAKNSGDEDGDTIRISPEALRESMEQVKLLRAGKAELATLAELLAELEADERADYSPF